MPDREDQAAPPRAGGVLSRRLPAPSPRTQRDLQALAYFTFVTLVLLWRVALNLDRWAGDPGDPLLNAWILAWDWHALLARVPHFFDTNIFFPYSLTLAYSESLLGHLPVAGPLIALTGNPLLAANVLVLLSFSLGGWAMYFAVSRLSGSGWAGLIAGTVFAYQLERFAGFTHLQLLTTQWLPLVVYCADRLLTQGRWRYWLGLVVCFNLQFLSSYYLGLFTALTLALLVAGYLLARLVRWQPRLLWQAAAFAAVTLSLNLPLARPYFTLARQLKLARTSGDLALYSGSPRDYFTPDPRHYLWGALGQALDPQGLRGGEHHLFLGLVAWALALLALAWRAGTRESRRRVLVWGGVLAVLVVLSWGPKLGAVPLPYQLLFDYVPGFRSIRVPARLIALVACLAALLAGLGAQALLGRLGQWRRLAAPALCLLVVVEAGFLPVPGVIVPPPGQGPVVYQWLAQQPGDPVVLELPIPRNDLLQAYTQAARQYYSTQHWWRTVNGYSGFLTHAYLALAEASQGFPNPTTTAWLQGLRVDFVVLHRAEYEPEQWSQLLAALPRYAAQLRPLAEPDQALVLQVRLPEWNAGSERPEFGGRLRLLGYAPAPGALQLYWQRQGALGPCEVVLQGTHGVPTRVALPPGDGRLGEVEVQEVALTPALRSGQALALTVRERGQALPIQAGSQALTAVTLHPLSR